MHHDEGPPSDWRERFVSGYASAHPWEDFAETWAHYAVNSLNHSMGQPDLYPFVLAPTVMGKLRFVHGLIHRNET